MSAVIEKHIRISQKHHRVHEYLSKIPKAALTNEIHTLLSLGVMVMQQGVGAVAAGSAVSAPAVASAPITPAAASGVVAFEKASEVETQPEEEEFDISADGFFMEPQ